MSRAGMFWLALEEDYGNIETQGELVRALLTDREREALECGAEHIEEALFHVHWPEGKARAATLRNLLGET